ncbi:helix-turn-helix domain-containing protein [Pyramidobacter piscolens]|uniref:helix-turn-helix domain-containing protein n=1 Tax=Pyramidobacter piscolens TaxID=638849 RepID=UPI003AB26DE9
MIGKNLRRIRKQRNFTLKAIAEAVDSSIGYIYELETGNKTPSLSMLQKLAVALNASVNDLLGVNEKSPGE